MLDLQRQKSGFQNKHSVFFARGVIFGHLVLGGAAIAGLLFQQLFELTMASFGWYVASLALIVGMARAMQWARIALAAWFVFGAMGVFAYLGWWMPNPEPSPVIDDGVEMTSRASLSLRLLPLWLSTVALAYGAGGVVLLVSRRMQRATSRGFDLWDVPRV